MMNEEIAKYCLRAMLDESPCEECDIYGQCGTDHCEDDAIRFVLKELEELQRYRNDGWIPVSSGRLPKVEETVYIVAKRKYKDGSFRYIYTMAIYEDGTVRENDSRWNWYEIEGEWDEEEDCQIIPEGWFEDKVYNPEGVINYNVDDEVVAWKPITPYQPKGE